MSCFGGSRSHRDGARPKKQNAPGDAGGGYDSGEDRTAWRRFTRAHAGCWPVGHLHGWAGPSGVGGGEYAGHTHLTTRRCAARLTDEMRAVLLLPTLFTTV